MPGMTNPNPIQYVRTVDLIDPGASADDHPTLAASICVAQAIAFDGGDPIPGAEFVSARLGDAGEFIVHLRVPNEHLNVERRGDHWSVQVGGRELVTPPDLPGPDDDDHCLVALFVVAVAQRRVDTPFFRVASAPPEPAAHAHAVELESVAS